MFIMRHKNINNLTALPCITFISSTIVPTFSCLTFQESLKEPLKVIFLLSWFFVCLVLSLFCLLIKIIFTFFFLVIHDQYYLLSSPREYQSHLCINCFSKSCSVFSIRRIIVLLDICKLLFVFWKHNFNHIKHAFLEELMSAWVLFSFATLYSSIKLAFIAARWVFNLFGENGFLLVHLFHDLCFPPFCLVSLESSLQYPGCSSDCALWKLWCFIRKLNTELCPQH